MKVSCPISRILVPIDEGEESLRVVEYTGCLARGFGEAFAGITLIHVIGGGYLTSHAGYIDLRVLRLEESEAFHKIRQLHYEKDIFPFLDRAERVLLDLGISGDKIEKLIKHGNEAKEIVNHGRHEGFNTIILGRRTLAGTEDLSLGGVAHSVIQLGMEISIYLVGTKVLEDKRSPLPRILIAVDGSTNSMKALEHAACLVQPFLNSITKFTLLCVQGCEDMEPERIFARCQESLSALGLSDKIVSYVVRNGDPVKEIAKEAEEGDYTTVFLGRRGHSAIRHVTLGTIPQALIQRVLDSTIAIISS